MAQATTRIEVGAGILNPYTIHPAEIAIFAATLDEATGNRFNLGLAAGAGEFVKWVGLEAAQPLSRLHGTVTAIRSLLRRGERTPLTGDFCAGRTKPIYALTHTRHAHLHRRDGAEDAGADGRAGRRRPAAALPAGALLRACPTCKPALPSAHRPWANSTWPRASGSRWRRIERRAPRPGGKNRLLRPHAESG